MLTTSGPLHWERGIFPSGPWRGCGGTQQLENTPLWEEGGSRHPCSLQKEDGQSSGLARVASTLSLAFLSSVACWGCQKHPGMPVVSSLCFALGGCSPSWTGARCFLISVIST